MPLDWWLAFLVFLVGACVILLIALSRSRRKHQSSTEPELVLGPQPATDRPISTAAATDPAKARPAPYLAYLPDAQAQAPSSKPPDDAVGAKKSPRPQASTPSVAPSPEASEPASPDAAADQAAPDTKTSTEPVLIESPALIESTGLIKSTGLIESTVEAPELTPVRLHPAPAAADTDVPWWERAFLDNPPPNQEIIPSARPWHEDEPLPPPPPDDRRSHIHALLAMGARSSTTVTSGAVKGNRSSGLYHTVESPWYGRTKADEWFDTPGKAEAAGYIRWDDKSNRRTG